MTPRERAEVRDLALCVVVFALACLAVRPALYLLMVVTGNL